MGNNRVTVIELSRRPIHPETTYVVFEDSNKAKEFLDDISKNPHLFRVEKIRENIDEPKFGYIHEVFYDISFEKLRTAYYGTGQFGAR